MESVGQKLREARLRSGLSLPVISEQTRINCRILAAIEADDLAFIGSRFFYKSFVSQFARIVGADLQELSPSLQANWEQMPEPLVPGQPGAPASLELGSLRRERIAASRWVNSAALLIIMLVACSVVFGYWQRNREIDSAAQRPSSPVAVAASKPATEPVQVQVELAATEPSWVAVSSDGNRVFEGVLAAHERKDLHARTEAVVKTGNAGGIDAKLNGRDLGVLGAKGETRTVLFSKNGYEIEQPVSVPLAFANR